MLTGDQNRKSELARSEGILPVANVHELSRIDLGAVHTVTMVVCRGAPSGSLQSANGNEESPQEEGGRGMAGELRGARPTQ